MPLTKLGIRGLRAFEDKRGYCPRPNRGPNHEEAKPWQPATAAAAAAAPAQHGRKPDEGPDLLVVQQVELLTNNYATYYNLIRVSSQFGV